MDLPLFGSPDVTARTTVNDKGICLRLTAARGPAPTDIQLVDPDIVREHCAKLGKLVGRVAASCRQYWPVAADAASEALGNLAAAGRIFLFDVLHDPQRDFPRLSLFLQAACPTWQSRQSRTPLIHAIAEPNQYFPWELLPLFAPTSTMRADNQAELERAALAFPGFAAVVERRDPDHLPESTSLNGWDGLPIRMVYDASFPGVQQEVGFFRGKDALFLLRGPYPKDSADPAAPTLAQQLCDPALGLDHKRDGPLDQVVHFSCHCQAADGDTTRYAYHLSDEQGRKLVVPLEELVEEMMRIWAAEVMAARSGPRPDMPLVFLNGCGTVAMDPTSAASLHKPFRHNRNRGIIGTIANVPDRIAAEISKWFYLNLLVERHDVGQALHEAKWRLLQDRGNPLGLLYSIHAYAGLRIEPVPTYAGPADGGVR
ncbi:CHAT domain-containing protein [Micromonospora parva]|uniref:CHAT domain-containing protein n=1 Tax=Micromonospora parva TaxID=1464048 RepID=UPI0033CD17DA